VYASRTVRIVDGRLAPSPVALHQTAVQR
jgi:hypothetical protein